MFEGVLAIIIFAFILFAAYRLYERMLSKKEGYLIRIFTNVHSAHGMKGITHGSLVSVKLFPDKLTINDLAIIPIENISDVTDVRTFNHHNPRRRNPPIFPSPYHNMDILFTSKEGSNRRITFISPGKNSRMNEFCHILHKLKGIEKKEPPKPLKPYQL